MAELRYFYTDPLVAAYMAKHFGLMLSDKVGPPDYKLYVHSDSLPLFEPKYRDIWLYENGEECATLVGKVLRVTDGSVTIQMPERKNGKDFYCCPRSIGSVIYRDRRPFFWPEREGA